MTYYLISFPSSAMDVPDEEIPDVADAARAVIEQAKDAGVYVFGGGLDEEVAPVIVGVDGVVSDGTYPETRTLNGGFTVVKVASREDALRWAERIAVACRCGQEVREFMEDPSS